MSSDMGNSVVVADSGRLSPTAQATSGQTGQSPLVDETSRIEIQHALHDDDPDEPRIMSIAAGELRFGNMSEAMQEKEVFDRALPPKNYKKPGSILQLEESEMRELVAFIFNSIRSTDEIEDEERKKAAKSNNTVKKKAVKQDAVEVPSETNTSKFSKRKRVKTGSDDEEDDHQHPPTIPNTHARRVAQLSNRCVELLSWDILKRSLDIQNGNIGFPVYAPDVAKMQHFDSLYDRIDEICEGLRKQKSIVHSFIEISKVDRFLADPSGEQKRKETNRKLNKKKAELIAEKSVEKALPEESPNPPADPNYSDAETVGIIAPEATSTQEWQFEQSSLAQSSPLQNSAALYLPHLDSSADNGRLRYDVGPASDPPGPPYIVESSRAYQQRYLASTSQATLTHSLIPVSSLLSNAAQGISFEQPSPQDATTAFTGLPQATGVLHMDPQMDPQLEAFGNVQPTAQGGADLEDPAGLPFNFY